MIMTSLWKLTELQLELERAIAAIQDDESLSESEREAQLQQTFEQWINTGDDFKLKAEQIAAYIRHQEALAEARKNEARRLSALASEAENLAERLRGYLRDQMVRTNNTKIDGTLAKISLRKKPAKLVLNVPVEELPTEYTRITVSPKLDEIKKLLKTQFVEWASMSDDQGFSITIR
jgi:hypothetical protein